MRNCAHGPAIMSRSTGDSHENSGCSDKNFAASKLVPQGWPILAVNSMLAAMVLSITLPCTAPLGVKGADVEPGSVIGVVVSVPAKGAAIRVFLFFVGVVVVRQKNLRQSCVDCSFILGQQLIPAKLSSIHRTGWIVWIVGGLIADNIRIAGEIGARKIAVLGAPYFGVSQAQFKSRDLALFCDHPAASRLHIHRCFRRA